MMTYIASRISPYSYFSMSDNQALCEVSVEGLIAICMGSFIVLQVVGLYVSAGTPQYALMFGDTWWCIDPNDSDLIPFEVSPTDLMCLPRYLDIQEQCPRIECWQNLGIHMVTKHSNETMANSAFIEWALADFNSFP